MSGLGFALLRELSTNVFTDEAVNKLQTRSLTFRTVHQIACARVYCCQCYEPRSWRSLDPRASFVVEQTRYALDAQEFLA